MKKNVLLLFTLLISAVLISSCKSDDPASPPEAVEGDYFPSGEGTNYKYNMERTDSNGTQSSGTRNTYYGGAWELNGNYRVQVDSFSAQGISQRLETYFRTTQSGVFYFLDTAGLYESIPDTLLDYISLDGEFRLLTVPFSSGSNWTVFKMDLKYSILNFSPVQVTAHYTGQENITLTLNGTSQTKEAVKLRYDLVIQSPNPQNPFQMITKTYDAFAWLVSGIGFVKWQGNGAVLNAFAGTGIDLDDTSSVVSQTLVEYEIK